MNKRQVAYCIIAHSADAQLALLIRTLNHDKRSTVYLHLDAKVKLSDELKILEDSGQVRLVERFRVNWGGFSMIKATLMLLRSALSDPNNSEFVLLSGRCFPLRRMSAINEILLCDDVDHFSLWHFVAAPEGRLHHGSSENVEKFHFMDFELLNPARNKLNRSLFRIFKFINRYIPYRRRAPLLIVKGSQWFVASRSTANSLITPRPDLEVFFANCFAPDEMFFQTVYFNYIHPKSNNISFTDQNSTLQGLHYIARHQLESRTFRDRVFRRIDNRSVRSEDLQNAVSSDALFIRKCSLDDCAKLLDIYR